MKSNFSRYNLIILLTVFQQFYFSSFIVQCQSIKNANQDTSRVKRVYTPFGPTYKSNVHFVGKDSWIKILQNSIQVINNKSNAVNQEYINNKGHKQLFANVLNITNESIFQSSNILADKIDGWITSAECHPSISGSGPFKYYSSDFIVPSNPLKKSDQLIYLFIGIVTIKYGVGHIVQPVLQWGESPAGGGSYWSICNWYARSDYNFFYDSLIKVESGSHIKGIIELLSNQDTVYNYSSSFEVNGKRSELVVEGLPELLIPYVALETYELNDCAEYPIDEKIRFSNIQAIANLDNLPVLWRTNDRITNCGQFSKIITPTSTNGEIEIHFHTPTDINNLSDLHVYPNPGNEYLHISPNIPLEDFLIEIYDYRGNLLKTVLYEYFDFELNLDISYYSNGIYFVKFKYKNPITHKINTYTHKMIKSSI